MLHQRYAFEVEQPGGNRFFGLDLEVREKWAS